MADIAAALRRPTVIATGIATAMRMDIMPARLTVALRRPRRPRGVMVAPMMIKMATAGAVTVSTTAPARPRPRPVAARVDLLRPAPVAAALPRLQAQPLRPPRRADARDPRAR